MIITKKQFIEEMEKENELKKLIHREVLFFFANENFPRKGYEIAHHKTNTSDDSIIWSEYWEKHHPSHHFPSEPHECPSCLINKHDFVGGHVIVNNETYILPVCRECNSEYKNSKAERHAFYIKMESTVRAPED